MKLRGSHLVALGFAAAIGGWMLTGELIRGGQADANTETIAEREEKRSTEAFRVQVTEVQPSQRTSQLTVRGRTEASASVTVRAETAGTVRDIGFRKGEKVKAGDVLCTIEQGIRSTNMAQAEAALVQAEADYVATEKLVERGFATRSKLRQLKAALDAAKAQMASAEQEIGRTEIVATNDGQIQEPYAEVGDNLSSGGVCATLVQLDPMLFSGQVAEREIGAVERGMKANVRMISGEAVTGEIRYISPAADAQTRTFEIEIALDNKNGRLRDGMTATANIDLEPLSAFKLEQAWLTLDDAGQIGVRVVGEDDKVAFVPVTIIAQEADGVWVSGPEAGQRVITLGQDYVAAGQTVEAVPATASTVPSQTSETSS